jgi:hypothetical protein
VAGKGLAAVDTAFQPCAPMSGGYTYYLQKENDAWVVKFVSAWIV